MSAAMPHPLLGRAFHAMGGRARIDVLPRSDDEDLRDAAVALDAAEREVARLERAWSRFLPTSDVTRLNLAGGLPVQVEAATVTLVEVMIRAWEATDGAFDPTLLGALVALGYASSWDDPSSTSRLPADAQWRGAPGGITVDPVSCTVTLPIGTLIDAGGIGKGLAADLALTTALAHGAAGSIVDIGGDVRAGGTSPDGGWIVAVGHPGDDAAELARLRIADGAAATSGTARRRWRTADGVVAHHLVDPATGRPTATRGSDGAVVAQATVVAGSAAWAEAWTKFVFVRGADRGLGRLDELGLAAHVVTDRGAMAHNDAWARFAIAPVPAVPSEGGACR